MKKLSHDIESNILKIKTEKEFLNSALEIFRFQSSENLVYKNYIELLEIQTSSVNTIEQIPFLPIEFFKTMKVVSGQFEPQLIFSSSGTTGAEQSQHYIKDVSIYEKSYQKGFELFYGKPEEYCILALLPSYLEREDSSLVYMMNNLIKKSNHPKSGFYLNNEIELLETLKQLKNTNQKTILFGVTFALLDFVEKYSIEFSELIVMETGGMKGRRNEIIREELHSILCNGFGVNKINSEYSMTELLSQAYSKGHGIFKTPPWMRILIRDTNDALNFIAGNQTGGINVIDLANIYSCSFIATQDLGKLYNDKSFEVLGRFDLSDIRGCNLMVE